MDTVDKYNLILSWEEWLKTKPILKKLLINYKNCDWPASLTSYQYAESNNKTREYPFFSDAQLCLAHSVFYIVEGIDKLSAHINYVWEHTKTSSLAMMQMLGHRYRDENNFNRMTECYLKSAKRAQKLNSLKWGVSAYFYLASYAQNKLQAEDYICALLEQYVNKVSPSHQDLYNHKIYRPIVWLMCHAQTPRGQAVLGKLPSRVKRNNKYPLPNKTRQKILIKHYANIKREQGCYLGSNGTVAQGPNDPNRNHDPVWGWLKWYKAQVN